MADKKGLTDMPLKIIRKIVNYVPNRWNLSCTCKNIYEIVCDVEKFKYLLKIDSKEIFANYIVSR